MDISNESGVEAQFYSQWSEQHSPVYSPAITPLPHFDAVFRAYDSSSNADSERTAMALAWLRKGIGERNTVDEFLAYFFAMEIISCRLRDKLRFKVKDPGPWDGVKRILADKVGFTRFHDVREVRKGLVHGYRPLDRAFVEEITSYLKPLRKGVVFAIGDVIQVQDEILRAIADTTPRKAADLVSTLSGKLDGMPTDFDTVLDDYPSAELTERSMSLSIDDRGNLRATFKPSLNFRLPRGVVFKPMSTELRG